MVEFFINLVNIIDEVLEESEREKIGKILKCHE